MTNAESAAATGARSSLAIDNLRGVVILLVLAFHSVLAYIAFLPPHPFAFDQPPFLWRAFPIVDDQRWVGFDLFCAWLDVFLMSFFFLLSGLFAWPSLSRKGPARSCRTGCCASACRSPRWSSLLMPLALYPTYLQSAADPGIAAYLAPLASAAVLAERARCGFCGCCWSATCSRRAVPAARRPARRGAAAVALRAAVSGAVSRRSWSRLGAGLRAAGAGLRPIGLVAARAICVPAQPAAALRRVFLRRRRDRRVRHRARSGRAGRAACRGDGPPGSPPRGCCWRCGCGLTSLTMATPGAASPMLRVGADLSFVWPAFAGSFFALSLAVRFARVRSRAARQA